MGCGGVGCASPHNVTFNGNENSRMPGTVFEVTDAELASVDEYEVVSST